MLGFKTAPVQGFSEPWDDVKLYKKYKLTNERDRVHRVDDQADGAFCSKYVPSDSYRYFMFNFLTSSTYRAFVKRICGGTGINNMKEKYFNVPLFALPCDVGLVQKFNELTTAVYAQVYNCTQEISKLKSIRDFVLTLLMNGQVKVG